MSFTYDPTMFKEVFEHEFTWIHGFMRNVHRFGDANAIVYPGGSQNTSADQIWTYKTLNESVNQLFHALL